LGEDKPPKCDLITSSLKREGGYLIIPTEPGIGLQLNHEGIEKHPYKPRDMVTRLHEDGSVIDQ